MYGLTADFSKSFFFFPHSMSTAVRGGVAATFFNYACEINDCVFDHSCACRVRRNVTLCS